MKDAHGGKCGDKSGYSVCSLIVGYLFTALVLLNLLKKLFLLIFPRCSFQRCDNVLHSRKVFISLADWELVKILLIHRL